MQAFALAVLSSTSTPTNRTPDGLSCRAAADRAGASCWQTMHHDPQKLSTTTWPCSAARRNSWPVSVRPDTAGIGGRCPEGKIVVPTASDALADEERTSEQPAIIRRAAAPAVRMAALFPAAVTDQLRDTPEHYKS